MANTLEAADILQEKVNDLKKVLADQEQIHDMINDPLGKREIQRAIVDTRSIIDNTSVIHNLGILFMKIDLT